MAVVKVVFDHGLPRRTFQTYKWIAIAAVVYCLWTVIGGDPATVVNAMVALLAQRAAVSLLHPVHGGGRGAEAQPGGATPNELESAP